MNIRNKNTQQQYWSYYLNGDLQDFNKFIFFYTALAIIALHYEMSEFEQDETIVLMIFRLFILVLYIAAIYMIKKCGLKSREKWNIWLCVLYSTLSFHLIVIVHYQIWEKDHYPIFVLIHAIYILIYFAYTQIDHLLLLILPMLFYLIGVLWQAIAYYKNFSNFFFVFGVTLLVFLIGCDIAVSKFTRKQQLFNLYLKEMEDKKNIERRMSAELKLAQQEQQIKELENDVKILNTQIKSHFLLNVMENAVSLCEEDAHLAGIMLENTALYLQGKVHANAMQISLSEELNTVQAYLTIQKIRMSERLHYDLTYKTIPDVFIPPFAIQTLVENAVIHGLQEKLHGGHIAVKITEHKDTIDIEVSDNGVGFSTSKVSDSIAINEKYFDGLVKRGSIGLWNVQKRLRLCGSDGLHIASSHGQGTRISFSLAKNHKSESE